MQEADILAKSVEKWLGNPILRLFIKWVAKRENGESRLEKILRKCAGEDVKLNLQEFLGYKIVKFAIEKSAKSFEVEEIEKKNFIESLKIPIVRRGLTNILEGIAYYGVKRPQTTYAPFLVVWDYTKACNLRCKHCYENALPKPAPDELTTQEAFKVIDEFASAGVVALAFAGGEPLMRKDFFEVVSYATKKDFYVSLATNGTLITKEVARKLKDSCVQYVEISLDGFEKTHDKFRGIPGAWKKTVEGIKNCVKVGIDTCVATTTTRYNLKEIPKLMEFAEKELCVDRFIVFNYVPTGRGKEIIEEDLTPEEREELLQFLYSKLISPNCKLDVFSTAPQYAVTSLKYTDGPLIATHFTNEGMIRLLKGRTKVLTEFIGGCGAGRLYCGMEPNGDIQPCVFIPIKIGNIRKQKLVEIWRNSPVLKEIRERDKFEGCGKCKYKYVCGGCRARAYGYFKNLKAPDPSCSFNKTYWERLNQVKFSVS
ncbi:MAG: radical SAM protein [Candidatus Aenigmatarchaeota archaeon]